MAKTNKLSLGKSIKLSKNQLIVVCSALALVGVFYVWKTYAASCVSSKNCGTKMFIYKGDKKLVGVRACEAAGGEIVLYIAPNYKGNFTTEFFDSGGNSAGERITKPVTVKTYFTSRKIPAISYNPTVNAFQVSFSSKAGSGYTKKTFSQIVGC